MSKLLSPLSISGLTLKNRVILAPLTRARSGPERIPNDRMVEYYKQRAGFGLVISEATVVSEQGIGWVDSPGIYTDDMVAGWKKVVDAVHAEGGLISLQLWHTGRASHSTFQRGGQPPVGPSAIAIDGEVHGADGKRYPADVPRALETEEIAGVVESYRLGAENAKKAGFDAVEVHCANGYLLDTFLQSSTNVRTDAYGGSPENRFRIVKEVLEAVTTVFPANRVGVRISPHGAFNGMGSPDNPECFTYFAEQLDKFGLFYLHVMDGLSFGCFDESKAMSLADFRKVFSGPIMGNCGYTKELAEERIAAGDADMIAFGRPTLANPDLPARFANNWPLADTPDPSTWYVPLDEGYIDFPAYKAEA